MAKHPGLNEAGRRSRIPDRSNADEEAFFAETVAPILESFYQELEAQGQTPFVYDFKDFMTWVSNRTYINGRFLNNSPKPFFQGPLIDAYRNGGEDALKETFLPLVDLSIQLHNASIERIEVSKAEDIKILAKAGAKIQKILSGEPEETPMPAKASEVVKKSFWERIFGFGEKGKTAQNVAEQPPAAPAIQLTDEEIRDRIQPILWEQRDRYEGSVGRMYDGVKAEQLVRLSKAFNEGRMKALPLEADPAALKENGKVFPSYLIDR